MDALEAEIVELERRKEDLELEIKYKIALFTLLSNKNLTIDLILDQPKKKTFQSNWNKSIDNVAESIRNNNVSRIRLAADIKKYGRDNY